MLFFPENLSDNNENENEYPEYGVQVPTSWVRLKNGDELFKYNIDELHSGHWAGVFVSYKVGDKGLVTLEKIETAEEEWHIEEGGFVVQKVGRDRWKVLICQNISEETIQLELAHLL